MPRRKTVFANNEYYHVFNRTIHKEPIFVRRTDCKHASLTFSYYQIAKPPVRLSYFLSFGVAKRTEVLKNMSQKEKLVEILCYCLMPNHYHFLLKQLQENGISKFISLFQNSYTRYFNTKYDRQGHLYGGQFKSVHVEDNEQLLHLNRYIHLNPYTSYLVKSLDDLEKYEFSSFPEYLKKRQVKLCSGKIILSQFNNVESYKSFILNQADYQRSLKLVQHLTLE